MRIIVRALAALGILLLLVAIIVGAAPAGIAAWGVGHVSGGSVVLANAEGSLRAGRGRVTDAQGRWSVPVVWTLDAWSLVRGEVSIRFGAVPADAVRGVLTVTPAAIDARDIDATLPAAIVEAWLPPVVALDAGGQVRVSSPQFRLGERGRGRERGRGQGHALARWSPARVADTRANVIDFGVLSADVDARDDRILVKLASAGGDTTLAGEVTITTNAGARIDADVTLTPRTSTPSPILRMIAPFGTGAADGSTRFGYHGAWQPANR